MIYDILHKCTGFDWDGGNLEKNWNKHGVTSEECEQVFHNEPLLLLIDAKHSIDELRYHALGKTHHNRLLFLVFTIRGHHIRIISARIMNKKEREIYEQST